MKKKNKINPLYVLGGIAGILYVASEKKAEAIAEKKKELEGNVKDLLSPIIGDDATKAIIDAFGSKKPDKKPD